MQSRLTIAGLCVWVAAAGAALEGQSLVTSDQADHARPWLITAALLGYAGIRLLEHGVPERQAEEDRLRPNVVERNTTPPGGVPDSDRGDLGQTSTAPDLSENADARLRSAPARGQNPNVTGTTLGTKGERDRALGTRRRLGSWALLVLGAVYSALAAGLLAAGTSAGTVAWLWLLGIGAVVAGAALIDGRRMPWRWRPDRAASLQLGLLLAVVGVAIWLRVPNLATVPPNVHGDEADVGLLARDILAGRMPVLFATAPAAEATAVTFAVHAATMRLFGDNLVGLRMASALEGVLSVVLLYLLARRLWGSRPALLAAAFMAIAAWHIHFSRTGFHYMQAPVATLLTLYFLVRGIQDRRLLDWVLCGFAIGLSVEVYYAARLAPVVVAIYLGYRALTERGFLRSHAGGVLAMVCGALVFLAPMAVVYGRSEGSFIQRAAAVLVTNPTNLQHELDAYHVNSLWEVLAIQTQRSVEAFNIRGETSLEYGHPGPLFDFWTAALLAMGAFAALLRLGSARGVLLASWVWLALILGSILTTDALFSPHVVVAIPALMLVPALMLDRAWRGVSSLGGRLGSSVFAVPVCVVLGLALQANVHDYFDIQIVERQPAGRFTLLSRYAASTNASYRLYVIGRDDWTLTYDTPRFLIPSPDAVDVRNAPLALPLDRIPANKGVAFLVENNPADFEQRMSAIRRAYPDGVEATIAERPGGPATFTSYLVENAALAAAEPTASRD
ncbi:MAG TPA: glycosyltransferase family 39 protein [Chloroflexota bacterium]|nr:glycosyltransferase family 39 protein [Chloroflexota bacterium]